MPSPASAGLARARIRRRRGQVDGARHCVLGVRRSCSFGSHSFHGRHVSVGVLDIECRGGCAIARWLVARASSLPSKAMLICHILVFPLCDSGYGHRTASERSDQIDLPRGEGTFFTARRFQRCSFVVFVLHVRCMGRYMVFLRYLHSAGS